MPAAVLTVLLGATALGAGRSARLVEIAALAAALAIVPIRLRAAATFNRMPEYEILVRASRAVVARDQPMAAIEADFLPPTADPEFIFCILGGRIDRKAEWRTQIDWSGRVTYRRMRMR